jgi:hypothetical protein
VYKLIYSAKYSKVAGNKSNKTSIIFDKIGFEERYEKKIPEILNVRARRIY